MFNRIKSAPRLAQVLFALVLSLEIISFATLLQPVPIVRLLILSALMFLTLGGLRIARFILAFLLSAGALFLALSGAAAATSIGFKLIFHFLPATLLAATAAYLLFSKQLQIFLRTKPPHDSQPQNT